MKEVERKISKNKKNSKGLSTIVATLLILLLIFVAVGIIWVVVRNVIQEGTEQISLGKFTLDLKISRVQILDDSTVSVKVKRNTGAGDFIALNFIVKDGDNSEVVRIDTSLPELGEKSYNVTLQKTNASNIKTIEIAPIFLLDSGKEVVGPIKDEYEYSTSGTVSECVPSCPTGAECGSDGCEGTCGSGCSSGDVCNSTYQCVSEETCTDTCQSWGWTCNSVCGDPCGTCNLANAVSTCPSGSCILSSCLTTDYGNCDNLDANGCETNLLTDFNHCGSCTTSCTTGQSCIDGDCVTESTCTDNCTSLNYECGTQTICGESVECGSCGTNEICTLGNCVAQSSGVQTLELECESGTTYGTFNIVSETSGDYCGNAYRATPAGTTEYIWDSSNPDLSPNRVEIPVTLDGGTYKVCLHTYATGGATDALYVGFNQNNLKRIYAEEYNNLVWVQGVTNDENRLLFENLPSGSNTLIVTHADPGARCDKLIVTSDLNLDCSTFVC